MFSPEERERLREELVAAVIGLGWLYALHSRSCIERGKVWQAEYMISAIRDQALALAALRHRLRATQGRGFDGSRMA